jgi:predicted RNA-binding Zn ribbon-like protein
MPPSTPVQPRSRSSPGPIPHTLSDYLCIDLVNSRFTDHTGGGLVFDRLDMRGWQRWFCDRSGVAVQQPPSAAIRRQLIELRRLLRGLLESRRTPNQAARPELNAVLSVSSQLLRLSQLGQGVELKHVWRHQDWHAVMAATVASYAELVITDGIDRVGVCGNPDCTYIFYDETRNRSRRWCDATVCGNLSRVRRHRGT